MIAGLITFAVVAMTAAPIDPNVGVEWLKSGLLGLVLFWLLLKHLPDKDRQVERLVEGCDKQIADIVAKFDVALRESRKEFRETLETISTQHNQQLMAVLSALQTEFAKLRGQDDHPGTGRRTGG